MSCRIPMYLTRTATSFAASLTHDLGHVGQVEQLLLLDLPLPDKVIANIAAGAAAAGHARVLDWLINNTLTIRLPAATLETVVELGFVHGRTNILNWALDHGADMSPNTRNPFHLATEFCQPESLGSKRTRASVESITPSSPSIVLVYSTASLLPAGCQPWTGGNWNMPIAQCRCSRT
ncbi:hypothetical protein BC828DRAFT_291427 [Blastocladiella britannica]|nr:hypothetical protein BC828DRAFT_291427 [Blastocladiella britannica]